MADHCLGILFTYVELDITYREYIIYRLFSFRGSVQDYKIHMDMEIVKFTYEI